MPNQPHENEMVRQALGQVGAVYSDQLIGNTFFAAVSGCPRDHIFNYVKFLDDRAFRTNLELTDRIPVNCLVSGSTDRHGTRFAVKHSVVYINRSVATSGTLIHELLHALSHNDWYLWAAFKPGGLNEALTEYFTRKVVKKATDATFMVDRTGTYDDELAALLRMKEATKQATALPVGRIGRKQAQLPPPTPVKLGADLRMAYFRGQISPSLNQAVMYYQLR
jgi:hypothetical protein